MDRFSLNVVYEKASRVLFVEFLHVPSFSHVASLILGLCTCMGRWLMFVLLYLGGSCDVLLANRIIGNH